VQTGQNDTANDPPGGGAGLEPVGPAAYYRVKADLCQRMAAAASDPDLRDQWIQLSNQWTYLVLHADQRGDFSERKASFR
jgi:hypothetical protein